MSKEVVHRGPVRPCVIVHAILEAKDSDDPHYVTVVEHYRVIDHEFVGDDQGEVANGYTEHEHVGYTFEVNDDSDNYRITLPITKSQMSNLGLQLLQAATNEDR